MMRHNHEAGAPLTADCDNWCHAKAEGYRKQLEATMGGDRPLGERARFVLMTCQAMRANRKASPPIIIGAAPPLEDEIEAVVIGYRDRAIELQRVIDQQAKQIATDGQRLADLYDLARQHGLVVPTWPVEGDDDDDPARH